MAILFVAAEPNELRPFAERLTASRKLSWPLDYAWEGILEGRRVMLVANGAGPHLAERAVEVAVRAVSVADLSSSRLEGVVSVGYCGGLQADLQANRVFVPAEVVDAETGDTFVCDTAPWTANAGGRLISQNRVVNTSAMKAALGAAGYQIVDMEAAGVARRAKRADLPFCCIKVLTDRVDESFGLDLNSMRSEDGRIARGKIVVYALLHPALLPELFRLRRRSREAAQALGEFLVSCRIHFEGEPAFAG